MTNMIVMAGISARKPFCQCVCQCYHLPDFIWVTPPLDFALLFFSLQYSHSLLLLDLNGSLNNSAIYSPVYVILVSGSFSVTSLLISLSTICSQMSFLVNVWWAFVIRYEAVWVVCLHTVIAYNKCALEMSVGAFVAEDGCE